MSPYLLPLSFPSLSPSLSPPVDFVLRDPRAKHQEEPLSQLPHRRELAVVPKPWNKSYTTACTAIAELLFVTNATLRSVLNLWHETYGQLRLVNSRELVTHKVFELSLYQNMVVKENERVRNILLKKYVGFGWFYLPFISPLSLCCADGFQKFRTFFIRETSAS